MKTLLKLMGLAFFVVVLSYGCRKTAIDKVNNTEETFDVGAAKAWYYGEFAKSAEFKTAFSKNKKYVSWKYPSYTKKGNLEIIEFPLMTEKSNMTVTSETVLSEKNSQTIAAASLKRVVFIRGSNKEIKVRVLTYVPELSYLTSNKFDISNENIGQNNFNFTGRLYIKNWDGEIIGIHNYKDGKAKSKVKVKVKVKIKEKTENNVEDDCHQEYACEWEEVCIIVSVGDLPDNPICQRYPVNCEWVEVCVPNEDPEDPDPCELYGNCTPGEQCDLNPTPECMCEIYSIGCDEEPPPPPPVETCVECGNITEAEAEAHLNAITSSCNNTVGITTTGAASPPNANGVITKPWAGRGCGYTFTRLGFWTSSFSAHYLGTLFKENATHPWKFQEFHFNEVIMDSGELPPCYDTEIFSNIQGGIIENGLRAQGVGSFTVKFKITCPLFGASGKDRPMTETLGGLEKFYPQ